MPRLSAATLRGIVLQFELRPFRSPFRWHMELWRDRVCGAYCEKTLRGADLQPLLCNLLGRIAQHLYLVRNGGEFALTPTCSDRLFAFT